MEVPGNVGWSVLGEKSMDFYRDPLKFVNKHIASNNSKLFACRFLNKPTIFVCSGKGTRQVLEDADDCLEMGYKHFLEGMFGDNILFSSNEEANRLRKLLVQLFDSHGMSECEDILIKIVDDTFDNFKVGDTFYVYQTFKEIYTKVCLSLFLGLDLSNDEELVQTLVDLTTKHFRGVVSVPINVKLPGIGATSNFTKALNAKNELINLINKQKNSVKVGFPKTIQTIEGLDEPTIDHHLLLFTCALVPKVLSSVCTSVCIELGMLNTDDLHERVRNEADFLDKLILETERMHPPLLGGRRIVKKEFVVDGYTMPKGHAVLYMTNSSHKDETVFENPNAFRPDRWSERPELQNNLFIYGTGRRGCLGQKMAELLIKLPLSKLLTKFTLEMPEGQDMSYKYIPVLRPNKDPKMTLLYPGPVTPRPSKQLVKRSSSIFSRFKRQSGTDNTEPSSSQAPPKNVSSIIAATQSKAVNPESSTKWAPPKAVNTEPSATYDPFVPISPEPSTEQVPPSLASSILSATHFPPTNDTPLPSATQFPPLTAPPSSLASGIESSHELLSKPPSPVESAID